MRFNPLAHLRADQVTDLRHNDMFLNWLRDNRMVSPMEALKWRATPPTANGQYAMNPAMRAALVAWLRSHP